MCNNVFSPRTALPCNSHSSLQKKKCSERGLAYNHAVPYSYWKNRSYYIFGISCCGFVMKTTTQVWVCLWQTSSLTVSYVHSHLRQTKLLRSPNQSPGQRRVFSSPSFVIYLILNIFFDGGSITVMSLLKEVLCSQAILSFINLITLFPCNSSF